MICRASNTVCQPMFHRSPRHWATVLLTSAPGVPRNVSSTMPRRPKWCGLVHLQTCARSHPAVAGSMSAPTIVEHVPFVRDLGVMIDSELSMREHLSRTAQVCFYHLRRLLSVRRELGRDVASRLVSAYVLSRLDYCNAVLAGLPASTLAPLQRVLHAAARLVLDLWPRDHARDTSYERVALAADLPENWLYKLFLLVHKSSIGRAPANIADMLMAAGAVPSLVTLPRTATTLFHAPTVDLATGLFQSLLLELGICCRLTTWRSHRARPKCSNAAWKLLFNCVYCDWQHSVSLCAIGLFVGAHYKCLLIFDILTFFQSSSSLARSYRLHRCTVCCKAARRER